MNDRLILMARKASLCACLAMACGGFTACTDDYTLDDPGNYPSWLGGSIYEALKNPESLTNSGQQSLTGTFNNYVRLIDDLGYAETMSKTGSKTVFVANDSAFARFFANNQWGVTSYEQLTDAMKKQLLYASMLDNALLVEMLSNISDGSTAVTQGQSMKHTTGANVIDTITLLKTKADMPVNNSYWEKYYNQGIHIVMDATRPMMIHFTEEQMTTNNITTRNANSDFEVVTGTPYSQEEKSAYIFRNKIIHSDVTCKNGYIHQMEDVLVPPGNLAELIRTNGESNYYSRMLDRFSAPYYDAATTKNYNDYAEVNGLPHIDSVFQKRYFSSRSQGGTLNTDPNGIRVESILPYDPGWNNYNNGTNENTSKDVAAMFVPTDKALEQFFLPGGSGEFLINAFGKKPNTVENLAENIDSIPLQNVQQLISNLMQSSFVGTVPSKFGNVMDEAADPMGLTLDVLNKTADGKYDVKIANNGVAYMLNTMFAPPSLIAVSAPVTLLKEMSIMNKVVNDGINNTTELLGLNLNYYAYLLAMSANYAFFIPTNDAFERFYVDPAYLVEAQPRALKFYYSSRSPYVYCSAWSYNPQTGEIGDSIGRVNTTAFRSQLTDILNYHTIVLGEGERLGDNGNRFYKTKHGGEVMIDFSQTPQKVMSGAQIDGMQIPSTITHTYDQHNGVAYSIDRLIQAPQRSVLSVLEANPQFTEFLKLCNWHIDTAEDEVFENQDLMEFADDKLIEKSQITNKLRMAAYQTFVSNGGLTDNVNYFNSYNYTVYAPDNEAMQKAYALGLPTWNDVKAVYDQYKDDYETQKATNSITEEVQAARNKVLAMVNEINNFLRYHFQDNSVYADNVVEAGQYPTACADTLGIRQRLNVSGGQGKLTVTDRSGNSIDINTQLYNQMTRDYVIDKKQHSISTSSFAVVHQISSPLNSHTVSTDANGKQTDNGRYDFKWTGPNATARLRAYKKQFDNGLYRLYDETIRH
jgi:uncharacterized surface protein with fasciclin (FAS1) repeats